MTVSEMELRLDFLKDELKRQLQALETQPEPGIENEASRREAKAAVSKMMLELGALQMRLRDADRRT